MAPEIEILSLMKKGDIGSYGIDPGWPENSGFSTERVKPVSYTLMPYKALPLFATGFAACTGDTRFSFHATAPLVHTGIFVEKLLRF